jgi:hypothetical protein
MQFKQYILKAVVDTIGRFWQAFTIVNESGEPVRVTNGGLDVNIQDQHTPVIIASMSNEQASTLLASQLAIDDYSFDVDDVTDFVVGQYLSIFNIAANRFFLGTILTISDPTITVDTPMDFAYPVGSFVTGGDRNMNVDGSGTPIIFGLRNTEETIGSSFDITRVLFSCTTATSVDMSKFGDIVGGLTNGIVLRKKDGTYKNIFNVKTNLGLANIMYDFTIYDKDNPAQGQDGFTGRLTFASPGKIGVTIRLAPGEDLQLIIQDDLTDLTIFSMIAEGHIVE